MPTRPATFRPASGPGSDAARRQSRQVYDRRRRDESATRRLYGTERWRQRSLQQRRIEPLCRMCLAEGIVCEATTADHIVPHRGDVEAFWSNELQSLCDRHHSSVKQREEQPTLREG